MKSSTYRITAVRAREVLDSRGNPTVEAEVVTPRSFGRASVPSGASKGRLEALELRDGSEKRFHGKGVVRAVANVVDVIAPKIRGMDVSGRRAIDNAMIRLDGTENKSKLGANAILAVSMASAKASASAKSIILFEELKRRRAYTLPVPMMNVINGGEHAGNELAVQEFLIEPVGADNCTEAIRMGSEVYHSLKGVLSSRYGREAINVGDEGGFAPPMKLTRDALLAIRESISKAGYTEGDVRMGIDAASSVFYDQESRRYQIDGNRLDEGGLEDFYARLQDEFALLTIEDPFHEDAFDGFASITRRLGRKTKIIGDDIYVTNAERIRMGIRKRATNAVLIKLNQIGTVTETEDAVDLANRAGWSVVISHRSGETDDPFIAHLAVAYGADFIKAGAPARGERVAKYNELIRIGEELRGRALFAGSRFR